MIIKKSPEQVDKMAAAGQILVRCLRMLASKARSGVTTKELDAAAERFIRSQGAEPAFKGYRGFPGSICASPNSMVVHGIPGPYELKRGDVLFVDSVKGENLVFKDQFVTVAFPHDGAMIQGQNLRSGQLRQIGDARRHRALRI